MIFDVQHVLHLVILVVSWVLLSFSFHFLFLCLFFSFLLFVWSKLAGEVAKWSSCFLQTFLCLSNCFFSHFFSAALFLVLLLLNPVNCELDVSSGEVANWSALFPADLSLSSHNALNSGSVLSAVDLHKTGQIGSRQNSGETEKQFGGNFRNRK